MILNTNNKQNLLKATEITIEHYEREAEGFHARAVQHECDHLDGKLYPMRMSNFETFGFADEVNKNSRLMRKGKGLSPDFVDLEEEQWC